MADAVHESGLNVLRSTEGEAQPTIWLRGDVLACACPECGAPVSIRGWLLLGDCLRCGSSFELTEEQEREARRLLDRAEPKSEPVRQAPQPSAKERPAEPPAARPAAKVAAAPVRKVVPPPLPPKPAPALQAAVVVEPLSWRDLFHDLPAWIASLIVHMVLILLLALWVPSRDVDSEQIVLSAIMGEKHQAGEPAQPDARHDEVEIAGAGQPPPQPPPPPPPSPTAQLEADARELIEPPERQPKSLPKLDRVLAALAEPSRDRMFEGRDPRVRAQVVNREGGTTYTEAAVARGLRWLAKHQHVNGSWSLHAFHTAGDCNGQCNGQGQEADTAATALALLPMLGAGQTHLQGRYAKQVSGGLRHLLSRQAADGDLRGNGAGRMYAHGQATIVLCEAYALSGDEQLREPAERAVRYIVQAQHPEGGWRYNPGEPGDTSVVGWQLMALRSARMALLEVPDDVFSRAGQYLDRAQCDPQGASYTYQPGGGPTATMTAEALLCRQYLGWSADEPGLRIGSRVLAREFLPRVDQPNIYYWYYATQVMHHLGGRRWETWNRHLRDTLVTMQETQGHAAGSWAPVGGAIGNHDTQAGGRIYMTSLAICTLEVYYRHLPLYRKIKIDPLR